MNLSFKRVDLIINTNIIYHEKHNVSLTFMTYGHGHSANAFVWDDFNRE